MKQLDDAEADADSALDLILQGREEPEELATLPKDVRTSAAKGKHGQPRNGHSTHTQPTLARWQSSLMTHVLAIHLLPPASLFGPPSPGYYIKADAKYQKEDSLGAISDARAGLFLLVRSLITSHRDCVHLQA